MPGEFQEARKRIMALTSGVQTSQDRVRQLEAALISVNERMEAMRARISAAGPPLTSRVAPVGTRPHRLANAS